MRAGKAWFWLALALLLLPGAADDGRPAPGAQVPAPASEFAWIEIWIDSGDRPLAAWQAELRVLTPGACIAGIEGGEPAAFREPPFYDPKALRAERAILAAFSTAARDSLPRGRVRVATVHVEAPAGTELASALILEASADPEGATLEATAATQSGR